MIDNQYLRWRFNYLSDAIRLIKKRPSAKQNPICALNNIIRLQIDTSN